VAAVAMIFAATFGHGCGYLENSGTQRANIPPVVFITNVPVPSVSHADTFWNPGHTLIDSIVTNFNRTDTTDVGTSDDSSKYEANTYLANPRIYWSATDEDGRVVAFEYAVAPTDSLDEHPAGLVTVRNSAGQVDPRRFVTDPLQREALDWILINDSTRPSGQAISNDVVGLYADIDTSVSIDQFLFVRAIDNKGLKSDVKFARYSRQNHPPQTYIRFETREILSPGCADDPLIVRNRKYYSLPQSTATYPGITIGWSGSDSTDYPDEQPPFEYYWKLFGPEEDSIAVKTSTRLRLTNDNLTTPRVEWTDEDRHTFFNLASGWYRFEIQARDDAFVADDSAAQVNFQVVNPSFNKDFMLWDASNWMSGLQQNAGSVFFREERLDSLTADTIRQMYRELFSGHGYEFVEWYRQDLDVVCRLDAPPDRDVMGQYKAIVVYDEDMQGTLDNEVGSLNTQRPFTNALGDYLDVGGRVVLIGRNMFAMDVGTTWQPGREFPEPVSLSGADFGFKYFAVTQVYFQSDLYYAAAVHVDSSDFVGVIALDPSFPVVVEDPRLISYLSLPFVPPGPIWSHIPDVNWIAIDRFRGAEGFYQFNSSDPNASFSQGRICGARYEFIDPILLRPTFRTAIVTFPLFPMRNDPNLKAMCGKLLDYILE
jgi:hypothetical protein